MNLIHRMVRGDLTRTGVAADLARAVSGVDPRLALADVSPMESLYGESLSQQRLGTFLLAAFGVFGLVLAVIGTYAVTAFRVGRRRSEIGIRLALGARPISFEGIFVRECFGFAIAGGLLGIATARFVQPLVASLLGAGFVRSPLLDGAVVLVLTVVATLAAWLPARRAARLEPLSALRGD